MGHHLRAISRLCILLSVWAVAALLALGAWRAWHENREIRSSMARNQAEYDQKLRELTRLLDEQQRLKDDPETQVSLLKQKLGYCEPGEIPIVIVDRSASSS